ncbi:hypothetical protein [Arthrobacter sp. DR-2P]|nr:hypothetical protein [Arthrobacter sp. DR-2P]
MLFYAPSVSISRGIFKELQKLLYLFAHRRILFFDIPVYLEKNRRFVVLVPDARPRPASVFESVWTGECRIEGKIAAMISSRRQN